MDLKSGYPFWPISNGLLASYPPLAGDTQCDVAIVGGGITGAMVGYFLAESGVDAVLIDRRDIGAGSTSASTALLQYEGDTHLYELIKRMGRRAAERSYRLCADAIDEIERLTQLLKSDCGFERKKSLYLSSTAADVEKLQREYEARSRAGFELKFLGRKDVEARFSFSAPAALLSRHGAQVDPYRLMHALHAQSARRGIRIFDRTHVKACVYRRRDAELITDRGFKLRARRVILAVGYEARPFLKQRIVDLNSSYAVISEPIADFSGWGENQCLIWESARPYLYMRTTADRRVLIGGEDDPYNDDEKRDRQLPAKSAKLTWRFKRMFPNIDLETAYSWAGTFGGTKDGLPYIGQAKQSGRGYFALGYGGNGIVYSVIAARILRDKCLGTSNKDANIFRFDR